MKNEMLALILAGGQGTRLGKLTQSIAKPAVQFGGRYRIIDFEDAHRLNIISIDTLASLFLAFFDKEEGYASRANVEKTFQTILHYFLA